MYIFALLLSKFETNIKIQNYVNVVCGQRRREMRSCTSSLSQPQVSRTLNSYPANIFDLKDNVHQREIAHVNFRRTFIQQ